MTVLPPTGIALHENASISVSVRRLPVVDCSQIPMRTLCSLCLVMVLATFARADIASDYAAITSTLTTVNAGGGTPGDGAIFWRAAFPFLRDTGAATLVAAGLYNGSAAGGRGPALTHPIFSDGSDATRGKLRENLAKWAGKKASPLIGVQTGETALVTFSQGKG